MTMRRSGLSGILASLAVGACSGAAVQPDVPALRTGVTQASTQEIAQTVSTAMNGVPVTVADDALTTESTLLIERSTQRALGRPQVPGRSLERPQHFQLVVDASQCFLVHRETGLRWLLAETECVPE